MEFKIITNKIVLSDLKIKIGDFCNLLPSYMGVYNPDDNPDFSKEQFIDLIKRQIDIRVKSKAKAILKEGESTIEKNRYSYFRIEWYEDDKMYDLYLPDEHLKGIRYIFPGDWVIINPTKLEKFINQYNFSDNEEENAELIIDIKAMAKNKEKLYVERMNTYDEPYNKFSNWWAVLRLNEYEKQPNDYFLYISDWCLEKPIYLHNKKPTIKKLFNY